MECVKIPLDMAKKSLYKPIPLVLILLEAAIGIEPMNKGFAVLAKLFAQVQPCFLVSSLITMFGISSLRLIA